LPITGEVTMLLMSGDREAGLEKRTYAVAQA
jgi:hypothetical protein